MNSVFLGLNLREYGILVGLLNEISLQEMMNDSRKVTAKEVVDLKDKLMIRMQLS